MQCLWIACLGSREAGSSRAVTGSVNRECPQFETEVDCPVFPLLSKERIFADHCKWLHESLPVAANVFQVLHCRLNCNTLLRMIPEKQQDPKLLVDMAKTCAEIGLAPDHWLLCKAQSVLDSLLA